MNDNDPTRRAGYVLGVFLGVVLVASVTIALALGVIALWKAVLG